jgi:hypothetical protein
VRTALAFIALIGTTSLSAADPVARVRGYSDKETRIIRYLLDRSATGRALVRELEASDVIVYVQLTGDESAGRAATRFVITTGGQRYLRVVIGTMTPQLDRPSLLAHELQHAVEIARAPDVRDDNGMRQLYRRIGDSRHARSDFETAAAREVGARVRRELIADRPPATTLLADAQESAQPGTACTMESCSENTPAGPAASLRPKPEAAKR